MLVLIFLQARNQATAGKVACANATFWSQVWRSTNKLFQILLHTNLRHINYACLQPLMTFCTAYVLWRFQRASPCHNAIWRFSSSIALYYTSHVPTFTYQVAGCVSGLYFLYFIFHSIFSLQRAHSPSWPTQRMFFVRWLVSYLVFLKAVEFLYFWARVLFALPFWQLIVTHCSEK